MHLMAQKVDTSGVILSMAKKVNSVLIAAAERFIVFKVSAAHFFVLPANPTASQDNSCRMNGRKISDEML